MSFHILLSSCKDGINFDEYKPFDVDSLSTLPDVRLIGASQYYCVLMSLVKPTTISFNPATIRQRTTHRTHRPITIPARASSMDVNSDPDGNPTNMACWPTGQQLATGSMTRRWQISTVLK